MRSDPIEIRYGPGGLGRELALGLLAFAVWIPVYVWNELSPWAYVVLGGIGALATVSLVRRHRRIASDRPLILTVSDEGLTRHSLDGVAWELSWEDIRSIEVEMRRLHERFLVVELTSEARARYWQAGVGPPTHVPIAGAELDADEILDLIESRWEPHRLAEVRRARASFDARSGPGVSRLEP